MEFHPPGRGHHALCVASSASCGTSDTRTKIGNPFPRAKRSQFVRGRAHDEVALNAGETPPALRFDPMFSRRRGKFVHAFATPQSTQPGELPSRPSSVRRSPQPRAHLTRRHRRSTKHDISDNYPISSSAAKSLGAAHRRTATTLLRSSTTRSRVSSRGALRLSRPRHLGVRDDTSRRNVRRARRELAAFGRDQRDQHSIVTASRAMSLSRCRFGREPHVRPVRCRPGLGRPDLVRLLGLAGARAHRGWPTLCPQPGPPSWLCPRADHRSIDDAHRGDPRST